MAEKAVEEVVEEKLKYLNIGLPSELHLAFKPKCVSNGQYVSDTLTALMAMYIAGEADESVVKYLQKKKSAEGE